jgi:hypothetical protein
MMRIRGLLIAVVVLAALGGAVWWSNKAKEAEAKKPAADATPKLVSIPEDQVAKVQIRKSGGEDLVLDRKSGKWEITAPQPLTADQDAVGSLVSTVSALSSDRVVEEKAPDVSQYGLAKPALDVTVTKKDGKSQQVLVGDETPTSSGYFAKLAGDPRVFTIPSYSKTSLDKSAQDLRDKRLLTFDQNKLTRVELTAKGQDLEFGKNNQNEWAILKPKPLRADGLQVDELVRRLKDAKMDTAASPEDVKKALAGFSGGSAVAVAKVTDANGTQQLTVHKDKDKNYYAKSSAVEGVYKVASDVGDGLDKGLDDFRNKKVFDFGWNDPSKIEVKQGAQTSVYQKAGEKWMSAGRQMDTTSVQAVVDKLRDLAAATFPDKPFAAPALEINVTSGDGKRTENSAFAKSGNDWLARRGGEPTIYQLDPKAVDDLQKAIAEVKPAAAPKK